MNIFLLLIFIAVLAQTQSELSSGFPSPTKTLTSAAVQITQRNVSSDSIPVQKFMIPAAAIVKVSDQTYVPEAIAPTNKSLSESVLKKAAPTITSPPVPRVSSLSTTTTDKYDTARNVFKELSQLDGGCCNNCNKICGLTFKSPKAGTYLTNINNGSFLYMASQFSANATFTIGQNADCTWYIQSRGAYVSALNSITSRGSWVRFRSSVGQFERWYIEKHDEHVHIHSAELRDYYLTIDIYGIVRCTPGQASTFVAEYHPCDKAFGWI